MKRVLLLGDSIRLGYEPCVRGLLADAAHVLAPTENCQLSVNLLMYFWNWVAQVQPDLIHFNAGLWDSRRATPRGTDTVVPVDFYARNLRLFIALARQHTRAKLLWATITPLHQARYDVYTARLGYAGRDAAAIAAYNAAALEVMRETNVPVNDLGGFVTRAGPATLLGEDGIHYTSVGYETLAGEVARAIRAWL